MFSLEMKTEKKLLPIIQIRFWYRSWASYHGPYYNKITLEPKINGGSPLIVVWEKKYEIAGFRAVQYVCVYA